MRGRDSLRRYRFGVSLCCLLTVLLPGLAAAQEPPPRPFLRKVIQLDDAQLAAIERGEVVTKLLPATDKSEVAAFGVVKTAGNADQFLAADDGDGERDFLQGLDLLAATDGYRAKSLGLVLGRSLCGRRLGWNGCGRRRRGTALQGECFAQACVFCLGAGEFRAQFGDGGIGGLAGRMGMDAGAGQQGNDGQKASDMTALNLLMHGRWLMAW